MSTPGRAPALVALALLGCAPIDVRSSVTVEPNPTSTPAPRYGDQLVTRDFVADYVQLGAQLLIELREHPSCVSVRHVPVMRIEDIHRSARGFVAWDFALGAFTGGFAALAFAQPKLFSDRLIDGDGRVVYDYTAAYVTGAVFATISAGLLAAGIVDAIRSTDTTYYADAFAVEVGEPHPCAELEVRAVAERDLSVTLGEDFAVIEVRTDAEGRARVSLPPWTEPIPSDGRVPAVVRVAGPDGELEPRALVLSLRVPYAGFGAAHTGIADTRAPTPDQPDQPINQLGGRPPVEGPQP